MRAPRHPKCTPVHALPRRQKCTPTSIHRTKTLFQQGTNPPHACGCAWRELGHRHADNTTICPRGLDFWLYTHRERPGCNPFSLSKNICPLRSRPRPSPHLTGGHRELSSEHLANGPCQRCLDGLWRVINHLR